MNYAEHSTTEIYIECAKWDYLRKLLLGVNLYANFIAVYALYAGIETKFDWTWTIDLLNNEQHSDLVDMNAVKGYIEHLKKFPQAAHPFIGRFFRRKKKRMHDPSYYFLRA